MKAEINHKSLNKHGYFFFPKAISHNVDDLTRCLGKSRGTMLVQSDGSTHGFVSLFAIVSAAWKLVLSCTTSKS